MRHKQQHRKHVGKPPRPTAMTDQIYLFEDEEGWQWVWNVTTALLLAHAECERIILSLQELDITPDFVRFQYPGLDESYALTTDLTLPILLVPFRDKVRIIDGWNRLFHASVAGHDRMFAFVLTQAQANSCLVCKFPPGQGMPLAE